MTDLSIWKGSCNYTSKPTIKEELDTDEINYTLYDEELEQFDFKQEGEVVWR